MAATSGAAGTPAAQTGSSPSPALRWRQVYRGLESQISELRRWLAGLLPPCEARDDVMTVAVELATNAVRHTASGRGGRFALELTWSRFAVEVAVADGGAEDEPRLVDEPMSECGRGLRVVHALSSHTGVTGDRRGRLVWAEIPWALGDPPALDDPAVRRSATVTMCWQTSRTSSAARCAGDRSGTAARPWCALPATSSTSPARGMST